MKHLTVGELINKLEHFPEDEILYTSNGYYLDGSYGRYHHLHDDIMFNCIDDEWGEFSSKYKEVKVGDFLKLLKSVIEYSLVESYQGVVKYGKETLCWFSDSKVVDVIEFEGKVILLVIYPH